ncbi:MAG: ferrous iron transport protein B [Saprospiraceae bacterium]
MSKETGSQVNIALAGNPNCGKTTLFNRLTGLNQKTGNFPGTTVELKIGSWTNNQQVKINLLDLPGAYSLYPNTKDERVVISTFLDTHAANYPDVVVYVADVNKLDKHLLLFSQLKDLGIPILLVLNLVDQALEEGMKIDVDGLSRSLAVPIFSISSRTGLGVAELKEGLKNIIKELSFFAAPIPDYKLSSIELQVASRIQLELKEPGIYRALLLAHHSSWFYDKSSNNSKEIEEITNKIGFEPLPFQVKETMARYDWFTPIVAQNIKKAISLSEKRSQLIDRIVLNKYLGPIFFLGIMFLVFQAIFALASYPMDGIEYLFTETSNLLKTNLPANKVVDLITDGIIPGLGGILVFIPQIAILFFLISILEEIGYMARAAFIFDKIMQYFGLNGRSLVALISGAACAIPAIMSARTIAGWKERLVTILVTPLISCSARIPVYTLLIGFAIPSTQIGPFNLQGIAFMGLYILGIFAALTTALLLKWILKTDEESYLMLELPDYKKPVFRNLYLNVYDKVKSFSLEAGKIILIISVILWGLSTYGPGDALQKAEQEAISIAKEKNFNQNEEENLIAAYQIEASYAGILGKTIEPVIQPLGFDWKIGIALITSFAAREVFVGTMATIYSLGSAEDTGGLSERMIKEKNPVTGERVYSIATSLSLLIFYVFAMQCMSTLAVVKRETNSWKWPIIQFIFMTALAVLGSLLTYHLFS